MSSPSKPSVVLIPGFCSIATVLYDPLITELKTQGFKDITPLNLPSIDTISTKVSLKPNALEADIALIHSTLSQLIEEEGKDVIVVAHSYGGAPSLYACEGLWKSQRAGKKGGVVRAYLISAAIALPGQSVAGIRAAWAAANPGGGIDDESAGAKFEMVGEVCSISSRL